ncbi:unnamed protein product [Urochloa humidicola]
MAGSPDGDWDGGRNGNGDWDGGDVGLGIFTAQAAKFKGSSRLAAQASTAQASKIKGRRRSWCKIATARWTAHDGEGRTGSKRLGARCRTVFVMLLAGSRERQRASAPSLGGAILG